MTRALGFIIAILLSALTCLVALAWAIMSGVVGSGRRARSILISIDQLGNAAAAGDEDETFSARCYRMRATPKYARLMAAIDWAFERATGQIRHCEQAFFAERRRRARPYVDTSGDSRD